MFIYTIMSDENYSRKKPSGNKNVVDDEVKRLLKKSKGKVNADEFLRLRSKYDNQDLVDQIQSVFLEKHERITRKAKKFAELIKRKYSNSSYPFHVLLQKAQLYRKKHGLSDEEFAQFKRIYEQELVGASSPEIMLPTTNMMKILGSMSTGFENVNFKVDDIDYKYLQEILKSHAANRPLHAQVMLQSIQYSDCDYEALTGKYHRELGNRPGEHVHPVIAAMFLPKIELLENHFLYSNIAGIVKARYNKEPLTTRPDYELFYSLVTDPNDVVCSSRSPVIDLLNRVNVQVQLWNSVLHLRNGQYYNTSFREFISAIDLCKINKYDNPDLVYGRHDGTVLKRLISAFSFRPTVVATTPVHQLFSTNPYIQNVRPVVTSVPMVNLRLPLNLRDDAAVNLNDALSQNQLFIEGNTVVPKHTDLIYSRGVLMFFIDRRAQLMRISNMRPFNLGVMPTALAGFERLNDRQVNFEDNIKIRGDEYQLRSVVLNEVNKNIPNENIVVGSSAAIMIHADPAAGRSHNEYLQYDPYGVVEYNQGAQGNHNNPISQIFGTPGSGLEGHSFNEMARTRGCIFIYQITRDSTEGYLHY